MEKIDFNSDDGVDEHKDGRSKNGGARPGAGRPKGSMDETTRTRVAEKKAFQERVALNAMRLFDAQVSLAIGVQYLFRIHTDSKGKRGAPELVTSLEEIRDYLNGDYDGDPEDYYFITTKNPDNKAIENLLDRAFGRPDAKVDLTSGDEPLQGAAIQVTPAIVDRFVDFYKEESKLRRPDEQEPNTGDDK